jgi:hypothetical protein
MASSKSGSRLFSLTGLIFIFPTGSESANFRKGICDFFLSAFLNALPNDRTNQIKFDFLICFHFLVKRFRRSVVFSLCENFLVLCRRSSKMKLLTKSLCYLVQYFNLYSG